MKFTPLPLSGLVLVEPDVFTDLRGDFIETWNQDDFANAGLPETFKQQNHCLSYLAFCVACIIS